MNDLLLQGRTACVHKNPCGHSGRTQCVPTGENRKKRKPLNQDASQPEYVVFLRERNQSDDGMMY